MSLNADTWGIKTPHGLTRFKVCDGVPLVRVADPNGRLFEQYNLGRAPAILPPWVHWDEAQIRHLMDVGLIECCDENGDPTDSGRVIECLSALISLDVPQDAGAPRAAEALRSNGFRFANETIAVAVRRRKSGWKLGDADPA